MVMTMKMSIPILILFVFAQWAFAQPGGKPHKVTAYDYHDYTNSSIQQKTFNTYYGDFVVDEVWTFDRTVPGQVVRTEISILEGSDPPQYVCRINKFLSTTSAFLWTHNNSCNPFYDPPLVTRTREYDPPIPVSTNAMIPGVAWGNGAVMSQMSYPDQMQLPDNFYVDKNEVLGVENVSVPAGNFTGCLKIHRLRSVSGAPYIRIDWICPDMGLVKRIQGGSRMMELIDVTFTP
jgi:hypothetical protein